MTDEDAVRLFEAMSAGRLIVFAGAGLSMAAPSSLPNAANVANRCIDNHLARTGEDLTARFGGNLEGLAHHFRTVGSEEYFITSVVPWASLVRDPNAGHEAVADFLAAHLIRLCLTTNFDCLVESAATKLREPDFGAIVEPADVTRQTDHSPYVKLHGCSRLTSTRRATIWCTDQFGDVDVAQRMATLIDWVRHALAGADIVFVGFWSDWRHLTDALTSSLATILPRRIYLVDPGDAADLEHKAPSMWAWANRPGIAFRHVPESGAAFLAELRDRWSRNFLDRLVVDATGTHEALFGAPPDAFAAMHAGLAPEAKYSLRRDLTGTSWDRPVRDKAPGPQHHVAAAIHAALIRAGATYTPHTYSFGGRTLRLLCGFGKPLSTVRADYLAEPPLPILADEVVCTAIPDGAPPHIVRPHGGATVVRPGSAAVWRTHDALLEELRNALAVPA
jgi:hypothetical protein